MVLRASTLEEIHMSQDVDTFIAFAIAAVAAAVGVALVSPSNAYAESTAEYTATLAVLQEAVGGPQS
jgi:hypothetical protein